jgi:hypothetical protein
MSKEGAQTARRVLSIAVDTIILRNKPIRKYYDSVKKRKGSWKFALVSTVRKLTRGYPPCSLKEKPGSMKVQH